jgi:hypothetical protein
MNVQVMYKDDQIGEIDKAILDEMISGEKIKMFKRSDGWAVVGVDHTRGLGGMYGGPDRRGLYGLTEKVPYKIVA